MQDPPLRVCLRAVLRCLAPPLLVWGGDSQLDRMMVEGGGREMEMGGVPCARAARAMLALSSTGGWGVAASGLTAATGGSLEGGDGAEGQGQVQVQTQTDCVEELDEWVGLLARLGRGWRGARVGLQHSSRFQEAVAAVEQKGSGGDGGAKSALGKSGGRRKRSTTAASGETSSGRRRYTGDGADAIDGGGASKAPYAAQAGEGRRQSEASTRKSAAEDRGPNRRRRRRGS